jgi:hypothetical protein
VAAHDRAPAGADHDIVARENFIALNAFAKQNFFLSRFAIASGGNLGDFSYEGECEYGIARGGVPDWRELLL